MASRKSKQDSNVASAPDQTPPAPPAPEIDPAVATSYREITLQFANGVRKLRDVASLFFRKLTLAGGTLDKVPEEIQTEAYGALRDHWVEAHPAFHYLRGDDKTLTKIPHEVEGCVSLTGAEIMAHNRESLTKLTESDRNLSNIVQSHRNACSTYISKTYSRLLEMASPETEEKATSRTNEPPRPFAKFVKDTEEAIWKFAKSARKRGDGTVPTDKKITAMVVAMSKALEDDPA